MNLLILESPGKVKKVQSILGADWKVAASVGHVRDLPERELGIALPDFTATYIPTERGKDVLKRLAALVKDASAVYLATDPDREGEAIAWHVADALRLKNPKRVTYSEITASAIQAALKAPRSLWTWPWWRHRKPGAFSTVSAAIWSAGRFLVPLAHAFLPGGYKARRCGWWWSASEPSRALSPLPTTARSWLLSEAGAPCGLPSPGCRLARSICWTMPWPTALRLYLPSQ